MTNETDIFSPAFFLADHVAVENGKLYVNGGFWNRFNFATFPGIASFGVGVILSVPWRAYHQLHKFSVWFEDADGNRLPADFQGEFTIGASPEMKVGDPTIMPIGAMVGNFAFQSAGDYSAVLSVDGQVINRWSFRAAQVFSPAQPASSPPAVDPSSGN